MTTNHTPTPWVEGEPSPDIRARATIRANGWDVAHLFGIQAPANAAHIVRCVNSHDALVHALNMIVDCFEVESGAVSDACVLLASAALRAATGE